jgi:hypothetical protein
MHAHLACLGSLVWLEQVDAHDTAKLCKHTQQSFCGGDWGHSSKEHCGTCTPLAVGLCLFLCLWVPLLLLQLLLALLLLKLLLQLLLLLLMFTLCLLLLFLELLLLDGVDGVLQQLKGWV